MMDLEAEYNNRAKVPGHPAITAGWQRDAAAFRAGHAHAELGLAYGPGERERLDLFWPASGRAAPLALFLHGGYWQALDRTAFSHMAAGLNAHGVAVAVPSYDLCPHVRLAEIVAEIEQAASFLHRRHGRPMLRPPSGGRLHAVVGGEEGAEYTRQSREIARVWGGTWQSIPGADHFTVIAPLADPASTLVATARAMVPASKQAVVDQPH